jgi:hypothetical protein
MSDRWIKPAMVATDVGLVAYWAATAAAVIPPDEQAVLAAWNWSFVFLDLVAAITGLLTLPLLRRGHPAASGLRIVSLALTHAAGLNAVAFWTLRSEFDPAWWLPNLWLMIFPVVALTSLLRRRPATAVAPHTRRPHRAHRARYVRWGCVVCGCPRGATGASAVHAPTR